ncbi:MAG: DNA polymerase I [Caldilineaceae bacterium]|nr:DNA polymerase I [Caldilineaceae bacterium]
MTTLLLIDGHSQAYRAYFGMKTPLSTSTGEPTAAVYGFARKLFSVLREYEPDCVMTAFDLGDTWRHAEFPDYKATRERMPDDMHSQIERIQEMLAALSTPIVTYENYEADDVLGTLARLAAEQGQNVLILTGDRDMFQLVDDHVKILYTSGGPNPKTSVYGLTEIYDRYGLTPQQFIDLKALTGDTSDNIPGIPGVGEKTAIKFINQFGTLDNLYAHTDEISGPKTRQNVIDAQEQVLLNKKLVTINRDLDLTYDAEACRVRDYDRAAAVRFFNELEFRSLIQELPGDEEPAPEENTGQLSLFDEPSGASTQSGTAAEEAVEIRLPDPDVEYGLVQSEETLAQLLAMLDQAERLSFDVETTSTDAMQAELVGLGIAWETGKAAYIPVGHTAGEQLPWAEVLPRIQPYFADPSIPKLAHNAKYDLTVCLRYGLEIAGPIHDTMIMAWLLDPASRALGLKAQAWALLQWQMTELTDLIGKGRKQITMDAVEIAPAGAYCCADVDATLRIFDRLKPHLLEAEMWSLYETLELPLLPVLTEMEMTGVPLDLPYLAVLSQELALRLGELESELFTIVGHEFNLRSTQQLSDVLFGELAFPAKGLKKTSSGHISTAVGNLEKLANLTGELSSRQQRVLDIIFEQRQLEKLRGTYVDALPALINPATGRVHTSFNQTGAVTGRLSSSNPNLQNIPIRTEEGRRVRRAFIAPPGWTLISADYSQVELRVLAHVAKEPSLTAAFQADQDIHAATAGKLFGVPIEEVNKDQRGLAKTINFATVYGSSAFGISSRTEMTPDEARTFLDQYFATYPAIRDYIEETKRQANEEGCVSTLLGRKRYFPELQDEKTRFNVRQALERQAINAPIQGTAADIMKIAMTNLQRRLDEGGYRARMLLQVHDELVLEAPADELDDVAALVRTVMEEAFMLDVPLKVDVEVGPNWYDLEDI